ncbi:aminoglycoside phosphotransferase family protein [Streptomyces sp. NPDC048182]|uniref:aminoglycoside phosphotransferase family protein n=1 Tax=Streptomyces sp. NPDC048182 TaxID=3365507 RepID=UPI003716EE2A
MRQETGPDADRGNHQDAVTPWEDPEWRAAAGEWVERVLAEHGLRTTGPWRVRLRPWSVLARLPLGERDAVWFKANPPASRFEGALTEALARWVPGHVLRPLAVDAGRGWAMLPDGGELFRDALAREPVEAAEWEALLGQYAGVQRALEPRAGEIARLGVPDATPAALPGVLERHLFEDTVLGPDDRAALDRLRPRLADWCAELAAVGVADTLDHADLHDGQLFRPAPGRFTFFDWGDAVLSHPFCSLPVPARKAVERYGPELLPRLRDAYLEPWTGAGTSAAGLRRAARLAWRLSAVVRAGSWGRLFPTAPGAAPAAARARTLLELLAEPPL